MKSVEGIKGHKRDEKRRRKGKKSEYRRCTVCRRGKRGVEGGTENEEGRRRHGKGKET